jgi:hypothetical protein
LIDEILVGDADPSTPTFGDSRATFATHAGSSVETLVSGVAV